MSVRAASPETIAVPLDQPALYDGVLTRRVMAFLVDYAIIFLLCIPFAIVVAVLGVLTLGLGWMLFAVLGPIVALGYVAVTLGGRHQSTIGMRMAGLRIMRTDGGTVDGITAMIHTALFWIGNAVLTPLILLATWFTDRKRTLHDLLLGTVVVRTDPPL